MRSAAWPRRLRFFALEKLLLPLASAPLRGLVHSWRTQAPDAVAMARLFASPRVVVATYHGMLPHLLAFAPLAERHGRRLVVMLAPSLDGRLLGAALARFGIDHVRATTGSRGVTGSREFLARIAAGDVGVVAVDGPRGPRCVAKPGFLRLAARAKADTAIAVTSGGRGIRFGSWDGAHLPLPFARVELACELIPSATLGGGATDLSAIEQRMLAAARRIGSPILPEEAPVKPPSNDGGPRTIARDGAG
jgi:lysophospholipid acyltransferase (LPLAT)-like uncharacterized protein